MRTYNDLSHKFRLIIWGVYDPLEVHGDPMLGRDPGFNNPCFKGCHMLI